ncbi:MAG TPA: RIP metalloprotease RseP [Candidatus Limihabitans stercoravium]|nr:RIP metalloprotease RseP [Candidatus Limihabitans stercoravium]
MINIISNFSSAIGQFLYILLAIALLLVMVLIHEFGHYTAGKLLGFKINEFAVGMGPKILSKKKKNGEVFSLRAFPLGGFCAFEGENEDSSEPVPGAFNNQAPWKRIIVLVSGALFNFLTAVVCIVIAFSAFGDTAVSVGKVYEYSPSYTQGKLQEGDVFYSVNGKLIYLAADFSSYISGKETFDAVVIRDGEYVEVKDIPMGEYHINYVQASSADYDFGDYRPEYGHALYKINGQLIYEGDQKDIVLSSIEDGETIEVVFIDNYAKEHTITMTKADFVKNISWYNQSYKGVGIATNYAHVDYTFGQALSRTFPYCFRVGGLILETLGGLFTGAVGVNEMSGPVGTIGLTSQIVSTGIGNILLLVAIISVNLAVFNLLPVPALDGCQVIFVIIEWIRKKPIDRNLQGYINFAGLVFILLFAVMIDLLKVF